MMWRRLRRSSFRSEEELPLHKWVGTTENMHMHIRTPSLMLLNLWHLLLKVWTLLNLTFKNFGNILIFEVIQLRLDATPLLLPFIPTVFGETSIILHRLTVSRNLTVSVKSVNFNGIKATLLSLVQGHVWVAILTDNRWIVGWKCFWQRHSCLVTCGAAMCYTRNFPNVTLYIGLNAFGSPA